MGIIQELRTIIWKNYVIRKRHWFLTTTEILVPILLFLLLTYVRSKVPQLSKVQLPVQYSEPIEQLAFEQIGLNDLHVLYAPKAARATFIIDRVQERFQIPADAIHSFDTEKQLLASIPDNAEVVVAVVFHENGNNKRLDYDLRVFKDGLVWETNKLYSAEFPIVQPSPVSYNYHFHGFTAFQVGIDLAFIEYHNKSVSDVEFTLQQFPTPAMEVDVGIGTVIKKLMPLMTMLSFLFLSSSVIKRVVEEKSSGVKEYMKMVGMKPWMMWVGWILYALSCNIISLIFIVILMKVRCFNVSFPLIEFTDGTIMFVFLLLYCLASVAACFLLASFWTNPSIGMLFGILFWILSYFIPSYILTSSDTVRFGTKLAFALFPNMGLYFGYNALYSYETRNVGLTWSNIHLSGTGSTDDVTMLHVFVIYLIELVVLTLFANYIDNINPGSYGIAKSYLYPLHNFAKWQRKRKTKCNVIESGNLNQNPDVMIELCNLSKNYGNHEAVKDLNWEILKNQITVLLGQNGAGKTTTMSMLTGMIRATSGFIFVGQRELTSNIDEIRRDMGLCPQENLLFCDLTVVEHLIFFAMLKGRSLANASREAAEQLKIVGLDDKADKLPSALSGGMKRKLCLCMALMGDPSVLVLDEPTSGMDPETREKVSMMLLDVRRSKTIIISTHHMDDAEMLGDRIMIMSHGEKLCCDTPIILKQKYNTGYHLTVSLEDAKTSDKETLECCIKQFAPNYTFIKSETSKDDEKLNNRDNEIKCTIYYFLIDSNYDNSCYQSICKKIEDVFETAKIDFTITTLDDVLERVQENDKNNSYETNQLSTKEININHEVTTFKRLFALYKKRIFFFQQKYLLYLSALLVFIGCYLLSMLLGNGTTQTSGYTGPSLSLNLNTYGPTDVYYSSSLNNSIITDFYTQIAKSMRANVQKVNNLEDKILEIGTENIEFYKHHLIAAAQFNESHLNRNKQLINIFYSSSALHSLPISTGIALNALAKAKLGSNYEIITSITPLELNASAPPTGELFDAQIALLWLFFIPMGLLSLMSCFVIFPHYEIASDFLNIQIMTGLRPVIYWIASYAFDCILSIVSIFLIGVLFFLFDASTCMGYVTLMIILAVFVLSFMPLIYLISWSKTVVSGIARIVTLGLTFTIISTVIVLLLDYSGIESYVYWGGIVKVVLLLCMPPFMLGYNLIKFVQIAVENYNWRLMDPAKKAYLCMNSKNACCRAECAQFRDYWTKDGISGDIFLSLATIVVFFVFVERFTIFNLFARLIGQRVRSQPKLKNCTVSVANVKKTNRLTCVDFEVAPGECFGLLGVNGAGKTTTFKVLTKRENKNGGQIFVKGETDYINYDDDEYLAQFGYCPQENSFNPALTPNHLIQIMALLRGFDDKALDKITRNYLAMFGLEKYGDQPSSTLSGGNKRKLCTCLAFIAQPKVILLDEPTSGVDPVGRHKFWEVLRGYKAKFAARCSFILCSHSMDECEALCDRIAIMQAGAIRIKGTLQHLKQKYASGYKLKVTVREPPADEVDGGAGAPAGGAVDELRARIIAKFDASNCELYDANQNQLNFHVGRVERLSGMFEKMEAVRGEFRAVGVEVDYVVTASSLKDVLISIANGGEKCKSV